MDGPVGFTVYASTTKQYSNFETIVFDSALSNLSSYYNEKTGSFHVPHDGVYLFSVNFNAYNNHGMRIELIVSEKRIATALAEGSNVNEHNHASAFAIVECDAGFVVWARNRVSGSYLFAPYEISQFSGYLLYRYKYRENGI